MNVFANFRFIFPSIAFEEHLHDSSFLSKSQKKSTLSINKNKINSNIRTNDLSTDSSSSFLSLFPLKKLSFFIATCPCSIIQNACNPFCCCDVKCNVSSLDFPLKIIKKHKKRRTTSLFGTHRTFVQIKVYFSLIIHENPYIKGYISSWMIPDCSNKQTTDILDLHHGLRIFFNVKTSLKHQ